MILLRGDKLTNKRKAGTRETTMTTDKRDKCIIEHLLEGIPIVILLR
jgi:hypothetical protein